ncbi:MULTISPECIES: hypothetical protein [Neisseriaceae]|jgi:hypothetical protein|uniref:Uncharacterized protein n=1 Tax=Morococcus cerebrosus TaxID=1056807 RepID=A0A0C1GK37_9NEIS|nr:MULTISPECIES: hypothetical protein [Neisseriaceae]KIC05781.1 hypothetical protein MCC93_27640 [Morococcus cerebrosus]UNV86350.1 hypothetical protein MON37_06410 [Morococcus cerebrosus]
MKPILSRHTILSTLDSKQEDELEYLFEIIKKFSNILLSNKQILNNKQNWNELRFPYKNLLKDAEQCQIYDSMENVPDQIKHYIECYKLSNKIPRYLFLDITKIKLNTTKIIIPNFGIIKFKSKNTNLLKSEHIEFIAICKEDSGILTLYIKQKNNIKQKNKKIKLKNNKFQMENHDTEEENNNSQVKNWYTVLRTSKNFWPYKK